MIGFRPITVAELEAAGRDPAGVLSDPALRGLGVQIAQ
jgi:hypothetical protein